MEIIKIGDRNLSYFKPFFSEEPLPGQGALGILNEDGQPVGAGVFTVLGESCVLDDLYVEENSRRKGAGTLLFTKAREAMEAGGIRDYLAFYEEDPGLSAFLASLGFVSTAADPLCSIGVSEVLETEIYKKLSARRKNPDVVPVASLTKNRLGMCAEMIRQRGFTDELLAERAYDPELSLCLLKEKRPEGILLAKQVEGDFYVSLLLVDAEQSAAVPMLLRAFADAVSERAAEDSRIYYVDLEGQMSEPMTRFLGDESMIRRERATVSAVLTG